MIALFLTAVAVAYPLPPGDAANSDFTSVKVNGVEVPACSTAMNVGYAHFALSTPATVEITAREPIQSFDLSPHRYGIQAKADGNRLTFQLDRPRNLHLQVNGLTRFFLFASAPETPPATGFLDVAKLGVTPTSPSVQTQALQAAIDRAAAEKTTLYVPPGRYLTGQLRMRSNLTLHLAPGAVLMGTGNLADYPVEDFGTQLLYFKDCENVRLSGRGVIDGQGRALRLAGKNASASRLKLVRSFRAKNITVENVILRDSGTWGVHLIESENLRFSRCKLISNTIHDDPSFPWEPNTDGFDPDNSSRVVIEECFISSNDDAIAVKLRYGERRDMDSIQARNNVIWTVKSALVIGTEVADRKLTGVLFQNNDVIHADRGISMNCYFGGTILGPRWIGNHFEFIGGNLKRMHVEIKIRDEEGKGHIRDVLIQDNVFEQRAENASRLQGLDAEHEVAGVTFVNHVIAGRRCMNSDEAHLEISRHANGVKFSE